ncbi:replication protein [Deltaproteobacteria bacterium IMCC39524]|nr:replication protein [Deltaproteobacteria bacterium IMCC39524]
MFLIEKVMGFAEGHLQQCKINGDEWTPRDKNILKGPAIMEAQDQRHQPTSGYTQVENNLLEALFRTRFRNEEICVLLLIIRMTHGYHRKRSVLPFSYLSSSTGISKRSVERAIKSLITKGVVLKARSSNGNYYSVTSPASWMVSANEQNVNKVQKPLRQLSRNSPLHSGRTINKAEIKQSKESPFFEVHDVGKEVEIISISKQTDRASTRALTLTDLEALKCQDKVTLG